MMRLLQDESLRRSVKHWLGRIGYDTTHWVRTAMHDACSRRLHEIGIADKDALEISAGLYWRALGFRSFTEANFPEFDVCRDRLDRQFDIVIADQVFEHLPWPYRAVKNVYAMVRPGGVFMISTPFLVRVHEVPIDCSRWTETGLKYLLAEGGFPLERIETGSWGNRACVKANFTRWARHGFLRPTRNEPQFPVTVWAFAFKPCDSAGAAA